MAHRVCAPSRRDSPRDDIRTRTGRCPGRCLLHTSALDLRSPRAHICIGTGLTPCNMTRRISPLHGDWARCRPGLALGAWAHGLAATRICARSRIGSELPHRHPRSGWMHRQAGLGSLGPGLFRICTGMGSPRSGRAPGLGYLSPRPLARPTLAPKTAPQRGACDLRLPVCEVDAMCMVDADAPCCSAAWYFKTLPSLHYQTAHAERTPRECSGYPCEYTSSTCAC